MCYPWWQMFYLALITALGMLNHCSGSTRLVSIATSVTLAQQTCTAWPQKCLLATISNQLSSIINHSNKWHAQVYSPSSNSLGSLLLDTSQVTAPQAPVALICSQAQPAHDKKLLVQVLAQWLCRCTTPSKPRTTECSEPAFLQAWA